MGVEKKVGKRIAEYREKLQLSVDDLAAKCALTRRQLVAIESGEALPSVSVMARIARRLGQRLGTFMDDQYVQDPVCFQSEELAKTPPDAFAGVRDGFAFQSLAGGKPDRTLEPFRLVVSPDAATEPVSAEGEAFLVCFEGEVELLCGADTRVLKPGDTAFFNRVMKHTLKAVGGKPAIVYGVAYEPE